MVHIVALKKTKLQLLKEKKYEIIESGYEKIECYSDGRMSEKKLIGTTYLKEKMDYGFHIYHIHEPNKNNELAGINGTISEMYYDLRNREYWIKRNEKEVKFSPRNVDAIFNQHENLKSIFELISTENNKDLYIEAYRELGRINLEKTEMFGRFFHRLISEYSYFELLYKAGIKFKSNKRVSNPLGTSPREILGLSKTKWKMVSQYGLCPYEYSNYNESYDIKMLAYLHYMKQLEDEYGINKLQEFISSEFIYVYNEGHDYYSVLALCKRYNLPEKKALRYIYFECDVSQGMNHNTAQRQYKDYLLMVTDMEYENYERYPKFLKTSHDVVARNYNIKLSDIENKKWDKISKELEKYDYSYNGFKIKHPNKPQDLIKEGNVLNHCVGSYVGRMLKDSCRILFLRKSTDENHPLVTMELVGNSIVQVKGKANSNPTQDQYDFISKFAKKYNLEFKLKGE